jgi:hypothetical protein
MRDVCFEIANFVNARNVILPSMRRIDAMRRQQATEHFEFVLAQWMAIIAVVVGRCPD